MEESEPLKLDVKNTCLFFFFGLCYVFPLGLFFLTIGPTRMISDYAQSHLWKEETENTVQKIVMVLFLILILYLTIKSIRVFNNLRNNIIKKVLLVIYAVVMLFSVSIFCFQPTVLIDTERVDYVKNEDGIEFHFGSYPDDEKLEELKAKGYDGVISLLNELVVPAEPILMEKEAENTKKIGIKLISIPMLPWITSNDASVEKIKKIAKTYKGKYYVHCYLGKDRASVFKNIVTNVNKKISIKGEVSGRDIDTLDHFERGLIFKLDDHTYFTPYPTKEEFTSFILNGKIKSVVSLFDPNNVEEKPRLVQDGTIMKQYNQKYYNMPLRENLTQKELKKLAKSIQALEQPIVMYAYSSKSVMAKNFMKIYKEQLKK